MPRSERVKRSPTRWRVPSAMTTLPGSAKAWRRAARFGASPTTARSRALSLPTRSPTTTAPVAMPTRAASGVPSGACNLAVRLDDGEPGAHGAFRLMLVGGGPAEIGEDAITHVLGDVSLKPGDRLGAAFVIPTDHVAQVFRIDVPGQFGRTDQVDEHDRELPPFAQRCRRGWWRNRLRAGRLGSVVQGGDSRQQPLAVAKRRDTEFAQVTLGQGRQQAQLDIVVAERLLVLAKS